MTTRYRRKIMQAGVTPLLRGFAKGVLLVYSAACAALLIHILTR